MDSRPSRECTFLATAELFALRASCKRGSVGAVITINNRIVSTGYNGPVAGAVHCDAHTCDLSKPCIRAIHAELNAILAAAKAGISTDGGKLFCTTAPCYDCAKAILQAGIVEVHYMDNYRSNEGLKLLEQFKIPTIQYERHQQT